MKRLLMLILIMKNITNNTMYCTRTTYFFHNHLELNYKSFCLNVIPSHQHFHCILQLIYQLSFFYIYITLFIAFTFTIARIPNNPLSHISLSINFLHSHLHLSLFHLCLSLQALASSLHLHLQVSCHSVLLVLFISILFY